MRVIFRILVAQRAPGFWIAKVPKSKIQNPKLLVLALALAPLGCTGSTPEAPAAKQGSHLVVAVKGGLMLKRAGWKNFATALFGTTVYRDDYLRLDPSSSATVVCADLSVVEVAEREARQPCEPKLVALEWQGEQIAPTRAASYPPYRYPVVIAPRKTRVLDALPAIRWTAVPGVDEYMVAVRGPGVEWQSPEPVAGNSVQYPADAPPLKPGESYKVAVWQGNVNSDQEDVGGLGFTVVSSEEQKEVADLVAQIHALKLDTEAEELLVANLYATRELRADAIERLEALASEREAPAVERMLGELYVSVDRPDLAEPHYEEALQLSEQASDIEGQALANRSLGEIAYLSGADKAQVASRLQKALDLYQQLGDADGVQKTQAKLDEVSKP
jgi:hypothetical protein